MKRREGRARLPENSWNVFATVGSELPFDRLVQALDAWAGAQADTRVFAQIGPSALRPAYLESARFITPSRYQTLIKDADVVVGHAGIGTVLTAIDAGKPLVMIPRLAERNETRNNHQIATAKMLGHLPGVFVADDEGALAAALLRARRTPSVTAASSVVSPQLLETLRRTIEEVEHPGPIVAVSSGGGHWVQLARCLSIVDPTRLVVVTSDTRREVGVRCLKHHVVPEASRWDKLRLLRQAWQVWRVMRRVRPGVILTTGAAPGYWAIRFGKRLGARTIWLDSLANAEELSMSGHMAGKYADVWLTQWPHLAELGGPAYAGSVLDVVKPDCCNV